MDLSSKDIPPQPARNANIPRIAIVGAGISGLSTAWYLQKLLPNASIHLFEAGDKVGGVIQTVHTDPFLIEKGADNFATLMPDAIQMVDEMGLRDEFIAPKPDHRLAQVVRAGKVVPIPNGFSLMQPTRISSIVKTRALSMQGKLRMAAEYFVKRRESTTDESVESFAIRRLGRECFERLVEPIVGGIFTARSETLSMQAAMPQFVAMEREHGGLIRGAIAKQKNQEAAERSARQATGARYDQFLAPKQGMSWWLNAIRDRLTANIYLNQSITEIKQLEDQRWTLSAKTTPQSQTLPLEVFDSLILALPSHRSAALLQKPKPKLANLLERIPYASSAIAVLAVPRNEIRNEALCFGIVVPKIENRDVLAISLSSEKYDGRCPEGMVLLRVFMGGAVRPELMEKSDDQLLAIARKEVKELLGVSSLPLWQSLVRWNEAMPQYLVGHNALVSSIRDLLVDIPSLKLTGNAFDGVGIPQCVRGAKRIAEQVAKQFQSS
jgi:oxygen-dependent protoporphyrinogen oxidase